MATQIKEANSAYVLALGAAKELEAELPNHELLRLVRAKASPEDLDRWELERIERFWDKDPERLEHTPKGEVDTVTFTNLAAAMKEASRLPGITIRFPNGTEVFVMPNGDTHSKKLMETARPVSVEVEDDDIPF